MHALSDRQQFRRGCKSLSAVDVNVYKAPGRFTKQDPDVVIRREVTLVEDGGLPLRVTRLLCFPRNWDHALTLSDVAPA